MGLLLGIECLCFRIQRTLFKSSADEVREELHDKNMLAYLSLKGYGGFFAL